MARVYTVHYEIVTQASYDDAALIALKIGGFEDRANAEKALINLACNPNFRGGGITSNDWDAENEELEREMRELESVKEQRT
jgi:hypothetical protein